MPCTDDEWQLAEFGWCTDGRECSASEPCPWPLECAPDVYTGVDYCICTADVCTTTCAAAEECGDARLDCIDGLCRPLAVCSTTADCAADRVCGLLEGSESAGRRCITPGTAIAGEGCATHGECASGICLDGLCTTSCELTSDCEAGEECASVFGGAVAVCGAASCGCAADEVCTTAGECGAGPICVDDSACAGDDICAEELCRQTCDVTGDCLPGQDCVALAVDTPAVCAEAGCGCAADEVCEGGVCFVSTPCVDHGDCATGRCYGGQCREACNSTAVCPAGLECVAVNVDEHTFEMERLCVTPTCDCPDATSWCSPRVGPATAATTAALAQRAATGSAPTHRWSSGANLLASASVGAPTSRSVGRAAMGPTTAPTTASVRRRGAVSFRAVPTTASARRARSVGRARPGVRT